MLPRTSPHAMPSNHCSSLFLSSHLTKTFISKFENNQRKLLTSSLSSYSKPMLSVSCNALSQHNQKDSDFREEGSCTGGVSKTVVEILGGSQFGRMLCQAESQMGIMVMTLDPLENRPASSLSYEHVVGNFDDGHAVCEFAKRCGVPTFEIEQVDADAIQKLEKQGVDCEPKASTDKYVQKVHFALHGIPLPDFMEIDDLESAGKAGVLFGYPFMIKSKKLTYDGRGNAVAPSKEGLRSAVNSTPRVAIIIGSDSDLPWMKDATEILQSFDVPFELTIVSAAHRTPERMYSFALSAKERGIQTIIAGAGGAAHLPGMVASLTTLPVIGVPITTASLDGVDALHSVVQMPTGIPVAAVGIDNATNAGLLAARILASRDSDLYERLIKYQEAMKNSVISKSDEA